MEALPGGYKAIDVSIRTMKYSDGAWKIDVVITHLPEKTFKSIPWASGEFASELPQEKWIELLSLLGALVDSSIRQVVEPF
jgi:hypothetical protein